MKTNKKLLRLMNLPVFSGIRELASLIHVNSTLIAKLSKFPSRYYRRYTIKKSKGGVRQIRQPRKDLKAIQAWILRNILDKLSCSAYASAYIKDRNIYDNVAPHRYNRYFACMDLEDFFPSISAKRVADLFSLVGYSDRAADIVTMLCTCDGCLPQGAVTSPSLSNLIAGKLDRRIAGYTSRRNITYTRYADDITLSSNDPALLCQSLRRIRSIIKSEHFEPNMDKLRVLGPKKRCSITGLVKNNSESRFGIGRKKKRQMRAVMHRFLFGLGKDEKYSTESSIVGWLNYLKGVDEVSFQQMSKYWNNLKQTAPVP